MVPPSLHPVGLSACSAPQRPRRGPERARRPALPRRHIRGIVLVAALGLLLGACSSTSAARASATPGDGGRTPGPVASASSAAGSIPGWPDPGLATTSGPIPVLANSQLAVGDNRFLFTLINQQNAPIAAPDRTTRLSFFDLAADPAHPASTVDGSFVWAIQGERGFYTAPVTFARAGEWGVQVDTRDGSGATSSARIRFPVGQKTTTPRVGDPAPRSTNPTLADTGGDVKRISSDTNPDPDLYELTVADAIAQKRPFVLVFATPAFCVSRACGPTLDVVKRVKAQHPDFTYINVEPYKVEWKDGRLVPALDKDGQLQPVQAAIDWGLPVEPWIFVVRKDGTVGASFEAVVSDAELAAAIEAAR